MSVEKLVGLRPNECSLSTLTLPYSPLLSLSLPYSRPLPPGSFKKAIRLFAELKELVEIQFTANRIHGPIDKDIAALRKLRFLFLRSNQLTGTITCSLSLNLRGTGTTHSYPVTYSVHTLVSLTLTLTLALTLSPSL